MARSAFILPFPPCGGCRHSRPHPSSLIAYLRRDRPGAIVYSRAGAVLSPPFVSQLVWPASKPNHLWPYSNSLTAPERLTAGPPIFPLDSFPLPPSDIVHGPWRGLISDLVEFLRTTAPPLCFKRVACHHIAPMESRPYLPRRRS